MEQINIEELKETLMKRLEDVHIEESEIMNTNYMEDIEGAIIDLREPSTTRVYSNDLEGELLKQFDETKDYASRKELIEQIKQIREQKIRVQILREKRDTVKKNFILELEQKGKDIQGEIEQRDAKIAEIESQIEERRNIANKHISILGIEGLDKDVYKLADEKSKKYLNEIRARKAQITRLNNQKAAIQEDFEELQKYMAELNEDVKPEITESVEPQQKVTEPAEPQPKVTEPVEPQPKVTEPAEPQPKVTEPVEPQPKVAEPNEPKSEVTKQKVKTIEYIPLNADDNLNSRPMRNKNNKIDFMRVKETGRPLPGSPKSEHKLTGIKINPLKNTMTYQLDHGEYKEVEWEKEDEPVVDYRKKQIDRAMYLITGYTDYDVDSIIEAIDPNIVSLIANVFENNDDANEQIAMYLDSLKNNIVGHNLKISYDLTGIYDSNLDYKQIKNLNKIAKAATKKNKKTISVEKDGLLKRAFGSMKKRITYLTRDRLAEKNPKREEKDEPIIQDEQETENTNKMDQYKIGPVYVNPEKYGKEGAAALNKLHENLKEEITDIDNPESPEQTDSEDEINL